MTTTLPNRIIKYFVDTSNPSQSGFYFYEKAGAGGFVRLGSLADASRAGGNTFEIDSSTAENVIYNGLGGADTYVVRSNLDKNIEISDPHTGDDGSGNEAKNTIIFDSDVTVTSINQITRLEEADVLRIELTLDTGAVITVNGPDVFQYVVGGAAALDFAEFIATYGASGIAPANRAPVIDIASFVSIDENADGSVAPVPVGQIVASDADASDSLTYSIVSAVDQNGGSVTGFEVDGTGLITYVGTGLDAETITSVALTVSASDGEGSAQTSVAISVTNIDEGNARFVVTSDGDLTAAVAGDVLTVGTRSADPDGNDAFTYQWYCDGAEIADATGASYTIPEDYNRNSIYVVVRYTDGSGTNEVVTLSGILAPAPVDNIATAVAFGAGAVMSLAENTDTSARTKIADIVLMDADGGSTGTLELAGTHADMFEVDGNVLYLKVGASLDHESVDTLNIRVQLAEDVSVWVEASIAVANTDEGNARFVVTSDGDLNAAAAGDVLTVGTRSADPDGNDAFTYQWYRDGAEIADATDARYTITESDEGNSLYVAVSYTDGSGTNEVVTASGIIVPVPVDNITPATPPATPAVLNLAVLTPATGFRLKEPDWSEKEVSSVGDINDDGYDDFAIGARHAGPNGSSSGSTYVVFGKASGFSRTIDLSELDGSDGFRIDGQSAYDAIGSSISAADVNDDGYNDIIIGAYRADSNGSDSGSTYVVFGKESGFSRTTDLSELDGSDGFRIDGASANDRSGRSVSSGDVNGDGYDDIIIGADWARPNGEYYTGSTYVVFGKADGPNDLNGIIELSELDGSDGFRIDGVNRGDHSGFSVSAGDINGDGYDDVIIGAYGAGPNGYKSGSTYVVFGKASGFSRTMELSELDGSDGFRMDGESFDNFSGKSVSSAGDIDGDGYDDIIIGAYVARPNGYSSGSTYVVFGKASGFSRTMELSELDGSDGFRINGENSYNYSGYSVSSAGDFNGDGYDDIIIGAYGAAWNGFNSGSSYVVFGKESGFSRTIELSELDASDGLRIDGENSGDRSGYSVSSAGDVNDDGYDDVIIGASHNGRTEGHSYVVYGRATSVTDAEEDTAAPANIIVKYFVDTSNPSQSGFYFYEVAGDDNLVRLDRAYESTLGGDDTFEIDSPTAELVIYAGFGGADTYVIRGRLDNNVQIHDIDYGDDGSGNEVKNTIVFASDVTVTSIYQDRLQGRADVIKIEQTLDTDAVVTVHVPDAFEYVVGGAAALDFAGFIATYGASGISATNRVPVFENEPTDLSIDENVDGSAVPVSVGRVVASDADAGDTLTYSIVSTADQDGDSVTGFEVDGAGLITYVGTGLDAETVTSVALTVSASDGQESAQTSVAISVADLNDVAPAITSGASDDALTEGVAVPNTQVIYTATGTSDVTDISWSLSGPDAGLFNIDRATGEVRFDTETTPDAESKDSYSFTVTATSGALPSVTQDVTIEVTNIDEGNASFVITSDGDINAAVAGDVLTVGLRSSDPDGDGTFTYQWYRDGVDIAGATGAIYTITEGDEGNSLYVAVRYTDGSGTDETVTASGIIVPAPVDNADSSTTATPAVLNLADLTPATGFGLDGYGWTVLSGDVNGDGYDDIIIGAPYTSSNGLRNGSTYVVFGKADGPNGLNAIDLSALDGSDGFRMDGARTPWYGTGEFSGSSVSSGDVNGDGYDDIIIGAKNAHHNENFGGATYVVFGKQSGFSRTIDLSALDGSDGFRIDGENDRDHSGSSVSSAGDINGDGYDDVIVEASSADNIGYTQRHGADSGLSYIVFGKEGGFSRTMDLGALDGSDGFRIDAGIEYGSTNKGSVFSAGDINGDGFGDIIIGARWAIPNGADLLGFGNGITYVVFGKASGFSRTMDLSALDGSDGFRIIGENAALRFSAHSVSSAGDVNGDGYDDIIIGASGADSNGNINNGSTYVVFGKAGGFSGTVDIGALDGSDGFRIDGENTGDVSGRSVSSAGDFNGDGYDDIIIGAPGADHNGVDHYGIGSGSSYVVFGKEGGFSRTIDLSELDGSDGFRIDGESGGDSSGGTVSSVGDFNGDGYDDITIEGRSSSGFSYIIYGYSTSGTDLNDQARSPVISSGAAGAALPENTEVGTGTVIYDADGTFDAVAIVWSLKSDQSDDANLFNINRDNGAVTFKAATTPDAEAKDSYSFTVVATSGALASVEQAVTIAVTNIDEGNASFVVTSDRDINAAVAGDVLTVALRSSDPDGDGAFTYQWYRDGVDIAGATGVSYTIPEDYDGNSIYVVVRYTDGSGADETITASGIIVPVPADNDDDASEDPVNITYTMTQAPTGVSLTRGGVALSVGETFTYQDVQGGWVALTVNDENALSGLRLTTDDGTDADPEGISLDIEVREVADIAAPEAGNDLDYSENEGSLVIDTGDYGDQITAAQGSDFITGGLGDDTINLDPVEGRETGQDTVVYNFGSGSVFTAIDGGDDITGFKRGEDIFLLKTESDNPELATLDGLFSYVSGPNKGSSHDDLMIVTPNYEYEPDGDGGHTFFLTGITFNFEDAGVYGNGYLAKGHVSITFDERLDWDEFLSLIEIDNGDGTIDGNFDHYRGIIRDLSALPNLMGEGSLAYEVEAPAQTPPQDVDVPLEDDIPATSFDVV